MLPEETLSRGFMIDLYRLVGGNRPGLRYVSTVCLANFGENIPYVECHLRTRDSPRAGRTQLPRKVDSACGYCRKDDNFSDYTTTSQPHFHHGGPPLTPVNMPVAVD